MAGKGEESKGEKEIETFWWDLDNKNLLIKRPAS